MPKTTETVLEINLRALEHNYHYLKQRLKPETRFMGVVKAFAYGSDSVIIAKKLEALGADYLAVAYVKEGVVLRDAGIRTPIMVLHPLPISFDQMMERCLEPSLYSRKNVEAFLKTAKAKKQKNYPIHLKFNTGLNRLGFSADQVSYLASQVNGQEAVNVVSILSHLAASEDLGERAFTQGQIAAFENISEEIDSKLQSRPFRHLLNTSGIINYAEAQYDMVRSGIGLYGFGNDTKIDAELQPVATLKTVISQLHTIKSGESIGYNRAFIATTDRITATLPIGHADGIGRQYGRGNSQVTIAGQSAPIIGNVCMDMIMVDVTDISCQEGDEVIVFGQNQTANSIAKSAQTISYELLTGISQRVKRTIVS